MSAAGSPRGRYVAPLPPPSQGPSRAGTAPSSRQTSVAGTPSGTPRGALSGRHPFGAPRRGEAQRAQELAAPSVTGAELVLKLFQERGIIVPVEEKSVQAEANLRLLTMAEVLTEHGKYCELQLELRQREAEASEMASLVRLEEMRKRKEELREATEILYTINSKKEHIISLLQQQHLEEAVPVEEEYQEDFMKLMMKAAKSSEAIFFLREAAEKAQIFKESPTMWNAAVSNLPVVLASLSGLLKELRSVSGDMRDVQAALGAKGEREGEGEGEGGRGEGRAERGRKRSGAGEGAVRKLIAQWDEQKK